MQETDPAEKQDQVRLLWRMLAEHVYEDTIRDYGYADEEALDTVVDAWMDDSTNSAHRYDELFELMGGAPPKETRILDMAAGCGTFVFHGLMKGYDVWGVDSAGWKLEFNHRKVEVYEYPEEWKDRFVTAVGEALPFPDQHFDVCSSSQTLEHVADARQCLSELLRVTKTGGAIRIQCPDYRGTWEPHYRLPWLPLMPRRLARAYLRYCGRPARGLEAIHYVTARKIARDLRELAVDRPDCRLEILNAPRARFELSLEGRGIVPLPGSYAAYRAQRYLESLFHRTVQADLFVRLLPA